MLTYDHGYFKKNFAIHSTKSLIQENNEESKKNVSNFFFKPFVCVDSRILMNLDEYFYNYCNYLEHKGEEKFLNNENDSMPPEQLYLICFRKQIQNRIFLENNYWLTTVAEFKKNIFFFGLNEIGAEFYHADSIIPLFNVKLIFLR